MNKPQRHLIISLTVVLVSLFITTPVMAVPSLPSSFYGQVRVNGKNLPDGSVVRALIYGGMYAEGFTQTYQGDSVYVLDIPADDPATALLDGGREGDTIHFEVGGILADQTGIWHGGTNVKLDLTASAADVIIVTHVTPSPVPTQTPILLAQASHTDSAPTSTALISLQESSASPTPISSSITNTIVAQPASTSVPTERPLPDSTTSAPSSKKVFAITQSSPIFLSTPIAVGPEKVEENGYVYSIPTVTFAAMVIVLGGSFWFVRKKFSIMTKSKKSKQHKIQGGL